ncbi:MAG: hypothetical protein WC742_14660 [Gallionellaceae bacterium]
MTRKAGGGSPNLHEGRLGIPDFLRPCVQSLTDGAARPAFFD